MDKAELLDQVPFRDLIFVLIGVVAGFLGNYLNQQYNSYKVRKGFHKGVQAELGSLMQMLCLQFARIKSDEEILDIETVVELREYVLKHDLKNETIDDSSNWLSRNSDISPEQVVAYYNNNTSKRRNANRKLDFLVLRLFFIDSNLVLLSEIKEGLSCSIIELLRQVSFYNDISMQARNNTLMTFNEGLSVKNRDILSTSHDRHRSDIGFRTKHMITLIDSILVNIR